MLRMDERARHKNTFEFDAGREEMKHFQELLDELDDIELRELVDSIGITFELPHRN
jgi:hypothetical protein